MFVKFATFDAQEGWFLYSTYFSEIFWMSFKTGKKSKFAKSFYRDTHIRAATCLPVL